ncbi:13657_t:CDS:1, partial [Racocetra persica]
DAVPNRNSRCNPIRILYLGLKSRSLISYCVSVVGMNIATFLFRIGLCNAHSMRFMLCAMNWWRNSREDLLTAIS